MKRLAFKLGMKLLAYSGDAGARLWFHNDAMASVAERQIDGAEARRRAAENTVASLRTFVRTADSLLSMGEKDKAQAQLRMGLVLTGKDGVR
jgi:hypothetical protein